MLFSLSCIFIAIIAVYLLFLPPLFYCPVVSTSAADAPVIDYFVDDRTSTVELTGKQSHSLPQISPIFPYFSCTRHMLLLCYNPIQLHSLSLSPLMYLLLSYAAYYIYIIFSSEPCALLVNRIR